MNNEESKKKVLVIEDDIYVYDMIVFLLTEYRDCEVKVATDGMKAVEILNKETPNLIFLDFMLPKGDAIFICGEIKKDERMKNIPVILISASEKERIINKLEYDVDAFIRKPFDISEVLYNVDRLLSGNKEERIYMGLYSDDESVRRGAVKEIADKKDKNAVKILIEILTKEKNPGVLEAISSSLVEIGGSDVAVKMIPFLTSEDEYLRNLAYEILTNIGQDSIDMLVGLPGDANKDVKKSAIEILGEIGDVKAVPHLKEVLFDSDVNIVCAAAEAIGKIGDKDAIDALIKKYNISNEYVKYSCIVALGKIGDTKSVDFLLSALHSKELFVQYGIIEALGRIGDKKAVKHLIPLLESNDSLIYKAAMNSIGRIDIKSFDTIFKETDNKSLINCILSSLDDSNVRLKRYALIALASAGVLVVAEDLLKIYLENEELMPFVVQNLIKMGRSDLRLLFSILGNEDERARALAATILGDVQNEQALFMLKELARDNSPIVRCSAVKALGKLLNESNSYILTNLLKDEDNMVRMAAADSLGWSRAKGYVKELVSMLEDKHKDVVESAVSSLIMIGGKDVTDHLISAAKSEDPHIRERAIYTLGKLDLDIDSKEIFVNALKDDESMVRKAAVQAIGKYMDNSMIDSLIPCLEDSNSSVRILTVKTLSKFSNPKVADILLLYCDDKDTWVRYEVLKALGRFKGEKVLKALMSGLVQGESIMQIGACDSLADMGDPHAAEAIRRLTNSEDSKVRNAARNALEKLGV